VGVQIPVQAPAARPGSDLARLRAGDTVAHPLKPERRAWVRVAEGELTLTSRTLAECDSAAIAKESLLILRGKKPVQVLLFDVN
jgi:redox-sensitive bicupin YhaK (pirin superfamily)